MDAFASKCLETTPGFVTSPVFQSARGFDMLGNIRPVTDSREEYVNCLRAFFILIHQISSFPSFVMFELTTVVVNKAGGGNWASAPAAL